MQKLEFKHIKGYLYKNLYVMYKGDKYRLIGFMEKNKNIPLIDIDDIVFLEKDNTQYKAFIHEIKPILKPLSEFFDCYKWYIDLYNEFSEVTIDWFETKYLLLQEDDLTHLNYSQLDKIYSYNFDIYNLINKSLAISCYE